MTMYEAMLIVIELAEQNVLDEKFADDFELKQERNRQLTAVEALKVFADRIHRGHLVP